MSLLDLRLSQTALETFERCPRRFYLRYREALDWPAPVSADPEQLAEAMERGRRFHAWVERQGDGSASTADGADDRIPGDDPVLARWIRAYVESGLGTLPGLRIDEVELSAPLAGRRLVARCDRLLLSPDGLLTIYDWKTGAPLASPEQMAQRWQSRLYPWIVVRAAPNLFDGLDLAPEQVRMTYWHPEQPEAPVTIDHDSAAQAEAERRLIARLEDLEGRDMAADFPRTEDRRVCAHCAYRALCDRGPAGDGWDEVDLEEVDAYDSDIRALESP